MAVSQELGNSTHLSGDPSNSTYNSSCGSEGNSSISRGSSGGNSSGNSSGSEGHSMISLFHCIVRISLLSSFICVSFLGNTLLLLVFHRKPQLLQVANRFILNLLIADLFQTAIVIPWVVAGSLPSFWPLSQNTCTILVTLMHLFAYASINTIIVVSIDRYLSIIYPLSYPNKMTTTWGAMFILGTWIFSLIQSGPPAIGWGEIDYDMDSSLCVVIWSSSPSYTVLNIMLSFLCPVAILMGCYGMVFRAARRQNALVHPVRPRSLQEPVEETVAGEEASEGEEEDGDAIVSIPCPFQTSPKRCPVKPNPYHCKAARVIFVIIASFILCIGPYCLLAAVSTAVGTAPPWVNSFICLLFFLQCCLHPYTYGYMHKSIKKELTLALLGLFCRRPPRGQDSSTDNNFAMTMTMTDSRAFSSHFSLTSAWKS
ncbi:putative G-protein coupled receptor 101 [Phascolarctos cinereus]|uniref:Probable G-protein coupled receptor 101 n=1 Tax=Phascolarctos cinereus TaxID=38626 RepID=A0A6P5IZ51_PHACI|nr:probable G-protein coupled receptor 101 [Phascolarctos cinereus]